MKKGFTLIELLIVLAIIFILAAILLGGVRGCNSGYRTINTFTAEVVRKYEVNVPYGDDGTRTVYRVDVRQPNSEFVETLTNEDDYWQNKHNSATIHGNLIEHRWYQFTTRGVRDEYWSYFPNIMSATKVENPEGPKVIKGEIDY